MAAFIAVFGFLGGTFFIVMGCNQKPKAMDKVIGGLIMLSTLFIAIFAFPSRDNPSGNPSLFVPCIAMIIIGFIIAMISTFKKYFGKENRIKREQAIEQKAKEQENAKAKEYDDKCLKVYEIYLKDNYDINDDEVNNIISKSHNIPIDELKTLYNRGKEVKKIREDEKKKAELLAKRKKEKEKQQEEIKNSKLCGKDKYLDFLNTKLKGYNAVQSVYNMLGDAYVSGAVQARNPKQTDPYFFAGMANGLGGPAAAMMTANEIAAENAKAKRDGEIIAQNSMNKAVEMKKQAQKSNSIITNLKNMIDVVNSLLIDDDTDKNFKKMKITKTSYKVLDSKNVEVTINYETDDIKVLKKDGILDGSLNVYLLNSKNELVAEGYYNTPNMEVENDKYVTCSNIGFKTKGSIKVLCVSEKVSSIKSSEDYQIKVKPINIWTIEKIN